MARCLGKEEASIKLQEVHTAICGQEGSSLYRQLQRVGFYWPKMAKESTDTQTSCPIYQQNVDPIKSNFVTITGDWQSLYIDYLRDGVLLENHQDAYTIRKKSVRYSLHNGILYKKGFNGKFLRCLGHHKVDEVMNEMHQGDSGEHKGGRKLYEELIKIGYY